MAGNLLKNNLFFRRSEWRNVNKQSVFYDYQLQYSPQCKTMLLHLMYSFLTDIKFMYPRYVFIRVRFCVATCL
jgi:hypothetical protein